MLNLEIDGRKVQVAPGSTVMDAANALDIYVPHFCYHKKLSIAANCRMCLVQVEKAPKPLPACATPATEGMKVWTQSEQAKKAQQGVMEFLLINHPLDCPICDQGGECQLQDLAVGYGGSASRYTEPKRVVFHKNLGPLVSAEEMARCIQCTRCVRFGQEIAGVMELGMIGRGEHAEIVSFVGRTVDSELSGNMIDICPVGALTSKPFRYAARTWELARRRSVSPHDSLGSNLIVQVKDDRVLRVVPFENQAVNECWISDKDRFSYEALGSDERLTAPMIKDDGEWKTVDWPTALDFVATRLCRRSSASTAAPRSARSCRRTRRSRKWRSPRSSRARSAPTMSISACGRRDFRGDGQGAGIPWLGMPIADLETLQARAGRRQLPAQGPSARRAAAAAGGEEGRGDLDRCISVADDSRIPVAHSLIVPPSSLAARAGRDRRRRRAGGGQAGAAGARRNRAVGRGEGDRREPRLRRRQGDPARQLRRAARRRVAAAGARAGARRHRRRDARLPHRSGEQRRRLRRRRAAAPGADAGLNARTMIADPRKAYLVLGAEPEFDCANPVAARAALEKAEFVVVMSPFRYGIAYADVLLPVSPFTETAGTFVNCEGRVQSFNGVVTPLGETRPAWKVLRVLGSMLGLPGFDFDSIDDVRARLPAAADIAARLVQRDARRASRNLRSAANGLERVADVPIHFADPLVRRAPSLQQTATRSRRRRG